jgi:hypothetical protein
MIILYFSFKKMLLIFNGMLAWSLLLSSQVFFSSFFSFKKNDFDRDAGLESSSELGGHDTY